MSDSAVPDLRLILASQLAVHLKSLRKIRGLSQADLGKQLGVSQARIAAMEARPGSLTLDQLLRLLNALDVEVIIRADPGYRTAGKKSVKHAPEADQIASLAKLLGTTRERLEALASDASNAEKRADAPPSHGKARVPAPGLSTEKKRRVESSPTTGPLLPKNRGSW